MKVKKRRIALVVLIIVSMIMTGFVSEQVSEIGKNSIYAATNKKMGLIFQRKKLIVGMKESAEVTNLDLRSDMLTWKSSNKKVATVNSNGKVTAKKAGTVTITVVKKNNKKQKESCKLVVVNSLSGTYKKTKWKLDKKGKLEVSGTGNMYAKGKMPPWFKYKEFVKSAKIEVKEATNLSGLFMGCYCLESVNLSKLDTSKVTDMSNMFGDPEETIYAYGDRLPNKLKKLDVSGFDTSNVTNMYNMFSGCRNIKKIDVSTFNTSKVKNMSRMFRKCYFLENLDVSKFDTSKVTNMSEMFRSCISIKELDVTGFDTSKVISMFDMFDSCQILKTLDVSNFDTSKVINMEEMFSSCNALNTLDLSNFDISNVKYMDFMFYGCKELVTIHTPKQSAEQVPELPKGTWTDGSGQNYTTLPANATGSAVLVKVVEK